MSSVWEGERGSRGRGADPLARWAVEAELAPGARVGRYQVLGAIGRGGMGEVYAAYHPDLDRRIALKIVYGARAADPERQARLLREARMIARLNHPNIVSVYDAGVVGDQVYVAMEFVDGQTLDAWLRERNRCWREILDVFVAAGRGLAAAHAANLIHRDFKPQNVMIGCDGRVRVMDFGLARDVRAPGEPAPVCSEIVLSQATSTTAGALVGTPAYMAPEQLRGAELDLRADQFSFCVALHEAIFGTRPGVGAKGTRLRGARRPPVWLTNVVQRGLELDPDKRFSSMQELLRAVERLRKPIRARLAMAGVGILVAAGAVVAARVPKPVRFSCQPPDARIQAVWPSAEAPGSRRAALHRLVLTSGLTAAETVWRGLAATLDERVQRWAAMYRDACEATNLRGEQSAEVLDLRMACLTDYLDTTRAYVDGLLMSDPSRLGRAQATAMALPSVQRCAELKDLRSRVPLPSDPRARDEIERLRQAINDAEVLRSLRYERRAEDQLESLLPEIRALGYKPLLAQALQEEAATQSGLEQYTRARETAQEALNVAEASRDDLSAARVAEVLGWIESNLGRVTDAEQWMNFGEAAVERAGGRGTLVQGWLLNDRGNLLFAQGRFEEAERDYRAAIAIKSDVLGPRHPDVSGSLANLASDLEELEAWDEADELTTRALAIEQEASNQRSRAYAIILTTKAEILTHRGQLASAEATLSQALALEQELGDANQVKALTLTDLAHLLLCRGRAAEALDVIRKAQALQTRIGERDPIRLAVTAFEMGRAMVAIRSHVASGEQLAAGACAVLARGGYERLRREALDWSERLPAADRRRFAQTCVAAPGGTAISAPPAARARAADGPG